MDKSALKAELVAAIEKELAVLVASHEATVAGATHEEAKSEGDKDTRAIEQSYLARGQAARVAEVEAGLILVKAMAVPVAGDKVLVGMLATIEDDDGERRVLIAPYGGGQKLAGGTVQVVTPQAPLGRALLGKRAGDEVEVRIAGKPRAIAIHAIA